MIETIFNEALKTNTVQHLYLSEVIATIVRKMFFRKIPLPLLELIPAVSLRTPIEGTVTGLPNRVGSMVARGALIAHIENPRVNDEHLVDLREHQTRAAAELKSTEVNRAALLNLQTDLVRRDAIHTKVIANA